MFQHIFLTMVVLAIMICRFWSTSELRVSLGPLNRFRPSSKIFYWPFQGGASFVDLLCFCSVLSLLCLCARLFVCTLWSPAGKGLTSWLSFVVYAVSMSLSHCYPGSGVVLDCIDSSSLHPYLLYLARQWSVEFSEPNLNNLDKTGSFRIRENLQYKKTADSVLLSLFMRTNVKCNNYHAP